MKDNGLCKSDLQYWLNGSIRSLNERRRNGCGGVAGLVAGQRGVGEEARSWGGLEVGGSHRENGGRGSGSGHKLTESKGGGQEWHCGLCLMMHGVIFIVNEHTEARRKR